MDSVRNMEKMTFDLWDRKAWKAVSVEAVKSGHEWKAKCPWHDDKTPSLSINEEKRYFKCFGCGHSGSLYDPSRDPGRKKDSSLRPIAATYDYRDEAGNLLFQAVRYTPKEFKLRRPDGNGGYTWNLQGIEPILYRLRELNRGPDPCFVVEGEKDVDRVLGQGLTATCNPMGSGKWRPSYNRYLKDREVVILPDNDEPGQRHAGDVARQLFPVAKSVKILNLPDLPPKGDISDWLDNGGNRDRLIELVEACPFYQPNENGKLASSFDQAILDVDSFVKIQLPERKVILHPFIIEQNINLLTAWRGTGKSWFLLSCFDAITRGQSFGPWKTENPVPTLYLDGEMTSQDVQERLTVLDRSAKIPRKCPLYFYSDCYASSLGLPRAYLLNDVWKAFMMNYLIRMGIKLFGIDNISALTSGIDENEKQAWDPVAQWLLDLRFSGITTFLIHHTGKSGDQRGTSAREDFLDCSINLQRPPDYTPDQGARFIVKFKKARVRTADLPLINDVEFCLTEVDGKLMWTWKNADVMKVDNQKEVLRMFDEGISQTDIVRSLGLNKSTVSRIKTKAIRNGLLTPKCRLTEDGKKFVKC